MSRDAANILRELGRWCEEIATELEWSGLSPVDRAILEAHANHVGLAWRQRGSVTQEAMHRGLMSLYEACTDPATKAEVLAHAEQYKEGRKAGQRHLWTPIRAVLGAVEMASMVCAAADDTHESLARKMGEYAMKHYLRNGEIPTTDADAIAMRALGRACLAWNDKAPGMKPGGKYTSLAKALAKTSFAPSAATIKTAHHDRKSGRKAPAGRKKPPLQK